VRIGKFAIIGGLSAVRHDVPPFSMVVGNPARIYSINKVGLERAGFTEEKIEEIRNAFKILFMSELKIEDAIKQLESTNPSEEVKYLISFLLSSKRGWTKWEKELKDL
jgi:UDP-N-acetylglucosamine acyltransferase